MKEVVSDLISIIIPVYNVEKYLSRCLDSVINQSFSNIEVLLIDDGSTDRSGFLCDEYAKKDRRIKVLHKTNGGQSSARNVGLDNANGKYIGFVDSDDWIDFDVYLFLYNQLKETDADIANLKCVFAHENTAIDKQNKVSIQIFEGKDCLRNLMYEGTVGIPAAFGVYRGLYRKELLEDLKFVEGRINEDIVFCYQLYKRARRIVVSDRVGYFYFVNENSTTRNGLKKRDFDLLWACDQLESFSQNEVYKDIKYLVSIKKARSYFSLLAKIAYYGMNDTSLNEKEVIRSLTKNLRRKFFILMCSPVPVGRKVMVCALSIHINILKAPLQFYRKYIRRYD